METGASLENVEIVRRMLLAASSGDPLAGVPYFDPAMEWDLSGVEGWPEKEVYRGLAEIVPFLRGWAGSFAEWHFDVGTVQAASGERVFAEIHEWGIGAASKVTVDQHRYAVLSLRAGLIVSLLMFSDRPEALRAAGLES
jgi:ketosteroid isomerase-like protein